MFELGPNGYALSMASQKGRLPTVPAHRSTPQRKIAAAPYLGSTTFSLPDLHKGRHHVLDVTAALHNVPLSVPGRAVMSMQASR